MEENKDFAWFAENYERLIRKFIPQYNEIVETIVQLIPFSEKKKIKVLDLGIGSGNIALGILKKFPEAHLTGVDSSIEMISRAFDKLKKYKRRISLREMDFRHEIKGKFDLVVSNLAIHHLEDKEKRSLFKRIYKSLKKNGCFIMGDAIISKSEVLQEIYDKHYLNYLEENVKGEFDRFIRGKGAYYKGRWPDDRPATVDDQIKWLRRSGFKDVDCTWKRFNFAVVIGLKY